MREKEKGALPKRLARGWALSIASFLVAVTVATLYAGIELRVMDPSDALGTFVAVILLSVPTLYFIAYRRTLHVISTRAAGRHDGSGSR